MTYRAEDDPYGAEDGVDAVEAEQPRRRSLLPWILVIALLVGAGGGSVMAWRSFSGSADSPTPSGSATTAEKQVLPADLEALQKQMARSVQSTGELLAAQQAEIKRLAEQVAALTGKLDLMQGAATSAQAALPAQAASKKPAGAKPVAAKPTAQGGPISTGGAPLQTNR